MDKNQKRNKELQKTPIRKKIPIEKIDFDDNKFRFRIDFPEEEIHRLADSILNIGQINPTKVRIKNGRYQILAGWERALAVRFLGDRDLIVEIYEDLSDEDSLDVSIADNVVRSELSDLEIAKQADTLRKLGRDVAEIASKFGIKTDKVYDLLTLASMRNELQEAVHRGQIGLYHSIVLNKFQIEQQLEYLNQTINEGLSVRWLERELHALRRHPFKNYMSPDALKKLCGKIHAVKFVLNPVLEPVWYRHWEIFGMYDGVPAPFKCEATSSIPARNKNPPFVCINDIEWAVLRWGQYCSTEEDVKIESIPISKRDSWLFLCERCTKALFSNCKFHHDIVYRHGEIKEYLAHEKVP